MAQKGNQNAAKGRPITDALRIAMQLEVKHEGKMTKRLMVMANKVAKLAMDGEQWAVKEVWDRLEGKAPQAIDISGTIEHSEADPMSLILARLSGIAERSTPKPDDTIN